MEAGEVWKPTIYSNYEVSSLGRVRRVALHGKRRPPKLVAVSIASSGYPTVGLLNPDTGKRKHFEVHGLVCAAFHGPRPAGLIVRHLDGAKANVCESNLAWGTRSQNNLDIKWHGRKTTHAFEVWEVQLIKRLLHMGRSRASLAKCFGVADATIGKIKRGISYPDVEMLT